MTELATIENDALARLRAAGSLDELQAEQSELLGKRSPLNAIRQSLGQLAADERKKRGQELNDVRDRIEAAFAARREELRADARRARLANGSTSPRFRADRPAATST
jgi:phenylalanyl-tRNA synthetase alpha chain